MVLLGVWTLVGTIGFTFIEGWSLFDSFYMTILTISTVGDGEVHFLTRPGRIFASFVIVLGIGTTIYTSHDWARLFWKENFRVYWGKRE